ncbi:hypothetical protein BST61_g1000 [Cercospora zeina]
MAWSSITLRRDLHHKDIRLSVISCERWLLPADNLHACNPRGNDDDGITGETPQRGAACVLTENSMIPL